MRITLTLDPDAARVIRRRMATYGASLEQAVNDVIRSSSPIDSVGFKTETASLGQPSVDLDRSMRLLGILEDRELVRKASEN